MLAIVGLVKSGREKETVEAFLHMPYFGYMEVGRYMGAIGESNGHRFIGVVIK